MGLHRKMVYKTIEEAQGGIKRFLSRFPNKRKTLYKVYFCGEHRGYHFGTDESSSLGDYEFKKELPIYQQIDYWARRFAKEAKNHKEQAVKLNGSRDISIVAKRVFHGVTGAQKFKFSRMLKGISKRLTEDGLRKDIS